MQAEEAPVQVSDPRPRGTRRRPPGDSASRQRVLDAAVQCILEQGLYRASSNAIAEHAGLSWGVIQYYFGTREALMLAVLEEGARRLGSALQDATITGETLVARIDCYLEILASYYGSPDYLVFAQVLLSLSHDPRTSVQTRDRLERINARTQPQLRRLQAQVLEGTGVERKAVESLLFHSLRGLALSHVMLATVPSVHIPVVPQDFPEQRKLLAQALALLIDSESAKAKPALRLPAGRLAAVTPGRPRSARDSPGAGIPARAAPVPRKRGRIGRASAE
jgi:AcrR family transcriptional regulator